MHRIALIGLGMAAKPHARSLRDLSDRATVVAVFSPSVARRAAFAETYGYPTVDSLDAILNDPTIGAVGLLTPPNTHRDLVVRLTQAGKHVFLEKPLEISTPRALDLCQAARDANRIVAVCLQQRFRRAGIRLGVLLSEGQLGRLISCTTRIPLWRPQSYYDQPGRGEKMRDGGGVLLTQGIHTLDLMLSLMGPASEVCGYVATAGHRMETEDLAVAALRYENGALGLIEATTCAYPGQGETITIVGDRATAMLTGAGLQVAFHRGETEDFPEGKPAGGVGADPMDFPHDYHLAAWTDFLNAIEENRAPKVPAFEALKVHALIDAMIDAGSSAGKISVAPLP